MNLKKNRKIYAAKKMMQLVIYIQVANRISNVAEENHNSREGDYGSKNECIMKQKSRYYGSKK
jgi:hypothetical protein